MKFGLSNEERNQKAVEDLVEYYLRSKPKKVYVFFPAPLEDDGRTIFLEDAWRVNTSTHDMNNWLYTYRYYLSEKNAWDVWKHNVNRACKPYPSIIQRLYKEVKDEIKW